MRLPGIDVLRNLLLHGFSVYYFAVSHPYLLFFFLFDQMVLCDSNENRKELVQFYWLCELNWFDAVISIVNLYCGFILYKCEGMHWIIPCLFERSNKNQGLLSNTEEWLIEIVNYFQHILPSTVIMGYHGKSCSCVMFVSFDKLTKRIVRVKDSEG